MNGVGVKLGIADVVSILNACLLVSNMTTCVCLEKASTIVSQQVYVRTDSGEHTARAKTRVHTPSLDTTVEFFRGRMTMRLKIFRNKHSGVL